MEQITKAGEEFAPLKAVLPAAPTHAHVASLPAHTYKALLYKIADHLGFSGADGDALVEKAYAYTAAHPAKQGTLSQRVWLSKILVYQCVFIISSELFRQSGCYTEKNKPSSLTYYYRYRNAGELQLQQMPLSFRVVYILSHDIGFTAVEIAAILNTTLFKVKERYHKALAFLVAS